MINVEMKGLDELLGKLKNISKETSGKSGRFAIQKAGDVVLKAAIANAEQIDDSGTGQSIAKNIKKRFSTRRFKQTGDLMVRIGVQGGAVLQDGDKNKSSGKPTPHWRLLEFGTSKMEAKPFFRRALSDNVQQSTDEFVRQYQAKLDRMIKKGSI